MTRRDRKCGCVVQATKTKTNPARKKTKRTLEDFSEDENASGGSEDAAVEHCVPAQVHQTIEGTRSRSKRAPKPRVFADV